MLLKGCGVVVTKKLILSGRVQGVGMRYFISKSAKRFGVFGIVKNMPHGTVEAIIQGENKIVLLFLDYIFKNAPGYIEHKEIIDFPPSKAYKGFKVGWFR
jgi:acylphosphatase